MPAARPWTVAAGGRSAAATSSSSPAWRSETTSSSAPATMVPARSSRRSATVAAAGAATAVGAGRTALPQSHQDLDDELVEALVAVAADGQRVERRRVG